MPERTEYYGYYSGGDYFGTMPDNRVLKCETEREYHYLFDEELAETRPSLFFFVNAQNYNKIRKKYKGDNGTDGEV